MMILADFNKQSEIAIKQIIYTRHLPEDDTNINISNANSLLSLNLQNAGNTFIISLISFKKLSLNIL